MVPKSTNIAVVAFLGITPTFVAPTLARASACDMRIVARIVMPPGGTCWTYRGNATNFIGSFAAGQRILAEMRGEASSSDGNGRVSTSIENRRPSASGPDRFFTEAQGNGPALAFTTPRAGTYDFSYGPCAMLGAPGTVRICAK